MPSHSHNDATERRTLRRTLRQRRSDISPATADAAAVAACGWLAASPEFKSAQRIGGYIPVRGELDPLPLLRKALAAGKAVFVPRVVDARTMHFASWHPDCVMEPNRFKIPEPAAYETVHAPADSLDLVIVPLLGFDRRGTRLGYGAGYYDQAFAFKARASHRRPVLAGYAFALQECNTLAAATWDVPLDLVTTEQGIVRVQHHAP